MKSIIKPWHGIQREEIRWHPEVDEDLCIGLSSVHKLIKQHKLIQKAREELNAGREKYEAGKLII